jgi:dTDP-4-amino-4,6-dideoxygalactose transaminase
MFTLPKHLPPTAAPLSLSDLRPGLGAPPETVDLFRQAVAGYLGVRACFVAASGRTALYLLLKELAGTADHPARREVVMPAYTCPALVRVTLDAGLRPRLADLSPATLGYEPDGLAACLGEQTLAVIVVHPFGLPQPLDDVARQAQAAGAVVIQDAAQSLGARWAGQWVGTRGDVGLFSLGPGKPLSTGGGGILCTNDEVLIRRLERSCRLPPPALAAAWMPARLALLALVFRPTGWWLATRLGLHRLGDSEAAGGYTLAGLAPAQAALGLALLPRLEAINRRRRWSGCRC